MLNSFTLTKIFLIIILLPLGLLTKTHLGSGYEFVNNYLGGIIYVVFFIVLATMIFPKAALVKISLIVFCITCLLEFTQLIQIDFLNSLRQSFIIRALIGSVFNILDFAFYLVGAVIGYFILSALNKIHGRNQLGIT